MKAVMIHNLLNKERSALRYRILCTIVALALPLVVQGGQLTSFNVSKKGNRNYAILALHFDREVQYDLVELNGGNALQLTLRGCQLDPLAAEELASHRGGYIRNVGLSVRNEEAVLDFQFTTALKSVIWETRDPYTLILDLSPVAKAQPKSENPPPSIKKVTRAEERKTGGTATKTAPRKSEVIEKKAEQQINPPPQPKNKNSANTELAVDSGSMSPQEHFLKGSLLRHEGKYSEALHHFEQARRDPDLFARCTAEIANIHRQLGQDQNEIAEWEKLFGVLHEENRARSEQIGELMAAQAAGGEEETRGILKDSQWSSLLGGGMLTLALTGFVLLLLGATIRLHFTVRNLQKSQKPKEKPVSAPLEAERVTEPEVEPQPVVEARPEEQPAPVETAAPAEEEFADEEPTEISQSTEKTAQEVFSLSEQGLSIQEIAEKLGLGQDEVRLILNLQREEAPQE
jgi:tetratricopeptide (TPR) repeat protein